MTKPSKLMMKPSRSIQTQLPGTTKVRALYYLDRDDEAIQAYDEAIRIDPKYADAWYNKVRSFVELGEYDKAVKAYNEAVKIDPPIADRRSIASILYNKADALISFGHYDEAILVCNEVIKLDSQLAEAWYMKGIALRMLHRHTDAENAFKKSRELGYSGSLTVYEMPGLWTS